MYPDSAAASSSCDPPPSSAPFVSSQWQVAGVCAGCPSSCWLQSSRGGGGRRCPWSREQALRRTPLCGLPAGPLSLDLSGWFCGPQAGWRLSPNSDASGRRSREAVLGPSGQRRGIPESRACGFDWQCGILKCVRTVGPAGPQELLQIHVVYVFFFGLQSFPESVALCHGSRTAVCSPCSFVNSSFVSKLPG